jgi:hypothetical protein
MGTVSFYLSITHVANIYRQRLYQIMPRYKSIHFVLARMKVQTRMYFSTEWTGRGNQASAHYSALQKCTLMVYFILTSLRFAPAVHHLYTYTVLCIWSCNATRALHGAPMERRPVLQYAHVAQFRSQTACQLPRIFSADSWSLSVRRREKHESNQEMDEWVRTKELIFNCDENSDLIVWRIFSYWAPSLHNNLIACPGARFNIFILCSKTAR